MSLGGLFISTKLLRLFFCFVLFCKVADFSSLYLCNVVQIGYQVKKEENENGPCLDSSSGLNK